MTRDKNPIVKDQPAEMPSEGGPLAEYGGALPPAPAWFHDAVAVPYETGRVTVRGAEVTF
jgi:hypothetical protein